MMADEGSSGGGPELSKVGNLPSMSPEKAEDTSWAFYTYPLDAPAAAFAEFAPMVDLWRAKCGANQRWPAWRDFELMDFEGWWGQIGVGEIVPGHRGVNAILWGTRLTEWWGADLTKRDLVEISILGSPAYEQQIDYYKAMFTGERIGFNQGTMESLDRAFIHLKVVELPLSSDGVMPSHLLTAAMPCEPGSDAVPAMEPLPIPEITPRGQRQPAGPDYFRATSAAATATHSA